MKYVGIWLLSACVLAGNCVAEKSNAHSDAFPVFEDTFDADSLSRGIWTPFDRGTFSIENGVLRVTDGWVVAGGAEWANYSVELRARTPERERQVQIWAGFRHHNRDYRYVAALRGGANNQLYLARYGAEGYDEMLDEVALDFTPVPGVWYTVSGISGQITVDTCSSSSDFDTKISVFQGSCGVLTCVDGNDDSIQYAFNIYFIIVRLFEKVTKSLVFLFNFFNA